MTGWITNCQEVSRTLKAADRAYDKARKNASGLVLSDKLVAYANAHNAREAVYSDVRSMTRR